MVYDLKAKKWGHLRTIFATSGYSNQEVANVFVNIFTKTKIFTKIFYDITLGARYYWFMQKTRQQKSHATVPLRRQVSWEDVKETRNTYIKLYCCLYTVYEYMYCCIPIYQLGRSLSLFWTVYWRLYSPSAEHRYTPSRFLSVTNHIPYRVSSRWLISAGFWNNHFFSRIVAKITCI